MAGERPTAAESLHDITYWLNLSREFYEAFRCTRNLAEMYFAICVLAEHHNEAIGYLEFKEFLKHKVTTKQSEQHAANTVLFDLSKLKYIEVYDKETEQPWFADDVEVPTNARYLVGTDIISVTKTFRLAILQYLRLGFPALGLTSAHDPDVVVPQSAEIFSFMNGKYKKVWETYLDDLSGITNKRGDRVDWIFDRLCESTEYYLILHTLMQSALDTHKDVRDIEYIRRQALGTRTVEKKVEQEFRLMMDDLVERFKIVAIADNPLRKTCHFSQEAWRITETYLAKLHDITELLNQRILAIANEIAGEIK